MQHAAEGTDELHLSGGLTPRGWWEVGYADGLLDQPAATAYRPPTPTLAQRYAAGLAAGAFERRRRQQAAARAEAALRRTAG